MADYSIVRKTAGRIRFLVEDLKDYIDYKRAYVNMDSPRAAELDRQWSEYKRRMHASTRFHANPKAYEAWIRLHTTDVASTASAHTAALKRPRTSERNSMLSE